MLKNVEAKNERKHIPSRTIIPLGSFLIRNLENVDRKYPDIVHLKVGVSDFYLVTNPELIQEILVTKQRDFIKGKYLQRTKKVFGEGLLTSEGEFHHRQRRLVQPAFHQSRINGCADTMTAYTSRTMSAWHDGETVDIHGEMMRLTMSIVAKCLFDTDVASASKVIANDLTTTIEYFNRLSSPLAAILQRLPTNKKYEEAVKRIDSRIYSLIESRRKSGVDTGDLMSMLLHAKDEDGSEMNDSQLRDEVLILFAAGHETTANALAWTWYLLSENPEVEAKLHAEVDTLLPSNSLPTASDVPKLEYTTNVLTESMRLYPPAWILVREAVRDSKIGDYLLPQGSNIVISQYVTHHDSRFFKEPERFELERWTARMKKNLPKFAYFPFGGGPRSCVGEPFAWMEGVLILATISRRWKLSRDKTHKVEMLPRITLRPKYGMRMKLRKRTSEDD